MKPVLPATGCQVHLIFRLLTCWLPELTTFVLPFEANRLLVLSEALVAIVLHIGRGPATMTLGLRGLGLNFILGLIVVHIPWKPDAAKRVEASFQYSPFALVASSELVGIHHDEFYESLSCCRATVLIPFPDCC